MKRYEKAIVRSIEMNKVMSVKEFSNYIDSFGSNVIDSIFNYINEKLDEYTGSSSLDNLNTAFLYLERTLLNTEYDRKLIDRKFNKLIQKIDRIEIERKKYFTNIEKTITDLESLKSKIEDLYSLTDEEINKYRLVDYIIDNRYDISYLNQIFSKVPDLVNVRTKEDISLYEMIIDNYIESINNLNEEDMLYYSNVLSILNSQKSFKLKETDQKKVLKKIYNNLDKIHVEKNSRRDRKRKLEWINNLKELVLSKDTINKDIEHIASKYNIDIFFPEELSMYYQDNLVIDNRIVTDDYIITIDKNAEVIDDGLSCKKIPNGNYLLGVHIADPLGYYDYENPIIQEAINRTNNIYLPVKYTGKDNFKSSAIPIFDYSFGGNVASLKANGKKYARSHYFEINPNDGVVDEYHVKSIINISKNSTYDEIEKVLEKGTKDDNLHETIQNLRDVTEIVSKMYEPNELYNKLEDDDLSTKQPNNYAHKIVRLAELLVGERVANIFAEKGYPCLYRVHHIDESEKKALESVVANLRETYGSNQIDSLNSIISGIYPKGMYDLDGRHDGLKLDHYTRVHSPLRRAGDLLMEYAQSICLDQEPSDQELSLLEEELKSKKELLNQKETKISLFKNEIKRTFKRRH